MEDYPKAPAIIHDIESVEVHWAGLGKLLLGLVCIAIVHKLPTDPNARSSM